MRNPPSPAPSNNSEDKTRTIYKNWREGFVTPLLIASLVFGLLALIPAVSAAKSVIVSVIFILTLWANRGDRDTYMNDSGDF